MSNQPPVRPWFRLAGIRPTSAPVPAPAPAPAQEPRSFFSIPTFRTTSAPSSPHTQPTKPHEPTPPPPQPKPQQQPESQSRVVAASRGSAPSSPDKRVVHAPSSSLPTSPIQKAPLTNTNTNTNSNTNTNTYSVPSSPLKKPNTSPKTIKADSVYNSPNLKPNAPPPSPLILPPSQLNSDPKIPKEAEQKTMLVQQTVEKSKPWPNGTELHREEENHGKGKESATNDKGSYNKKVSHLDSEDSGMNVITIAGENRGAYMELVHSQKKHEANYLHKKGNGTKKNGEVGSDESECLSNIEESANRKDKNGKGRITSSFPMAAYMNSNVQCVNNSLLYNASCSHHDPGVRLSLSKKPHGGGYDFKEGVDGHNS